MASDVAAPYITTTMKDDDVASLSDEQIRSLLLEAESRLLNPTGDAGKDDKKGEESLSLTVADDAEGSRRPKIPGLNHKMSAQTYIHQSKDIATIDKSSTLPGSIKTLSETIRAVEKPTDEVKSKEKPHSGPQWFNLPKTVVTPELKRDLQLIRMRSILDPKRHYKKENGKVKAPEYSQVGTIIEGPTEFFSARIAKKDRKKTFVEEALATEKENGRFKRKYQEIQTTKTSGKKAHYKALQAKRARKNK